MRTLGIISSSLTLLTVSAVDVNWELISPYPAAAPLKSVTFGEGTFVAAGEKGTLLYSQDAGQSWQSIKNIPAVDFYGVTYGEGRFVAVGSGNQIFTSDNGLAWTAHPIESNNGLLTVLYGNGRFVAGGNGGLLLASDDGEAWTQVDSSTTAELRRGAFGGGTFLLVEGDGRQGILRSGDGLSWTQNPTEFPLFEEDCIECLRFLAVDGIAYGNDRFALEVMLERSHGIPAGKATLVSTDGIQWEISGTSPGAPGVFIDNLALNVLDFENSKFFHLRSEVVTDDLSNWTSLIFPDYEGPFMDPHPSRLQQAAYGDSTYVFVGQWWGSSVVVVGSDLSILDRVDSPSKSLNIMGVAKAGDTMVAVGETLAYSTNNGRTFWPLELPAEAGYLSSVEAAQDKFVAIGRDGTIIRSSNAVDWSKRLSNTTEHLLDLVFGDGLWVAVGEDGTIVSSPDASVFTLRPSGSGIPLRAITHGNNQFVIVGNSGAILTSSDAINWNMQGTDEALDLQGVTFGNGRFVAVGSEGIVHTSVDGEVWTSATVSGAPPLGDVAFAQGHFIAITDYSVVGAPWDTAYVSTDGTDWEPVNLPRTAIAIQSSAGDAFITSYSSYIAKAGFGTEGLQIEGDINAAGEFLLQLAAEPGADYTIYAATSLGQDSWEPVGSVTAASETLQWTDPAPAANTRFYRVQKETP